MRIVSPLLKHVVYRGLSMSGYLRRSAKIGPTVITYHGILPQEYEAQGVALDGHLITAEAFTRQIQLLKREYNVIAPEQFLSWVENKAQLPPRAVLLTCDDGLMNTVTDMLPIIRELNVPFLFFITGESLSETPGMLWYEKLYLRLTAVGPGISLELPWGREIIGKQSQQRIAVQWREYMRKLSAFDANARKVILENMRTQLGIPQEWESEYSRREAVRRRFYMMGRNELRQLMAAGVTIGAHSLSHPMLSRMSEELAFDEIRQSRVALQEAIGTEIRALAFPFGDSDSVGPRESLLARRAGFTCAFLNTETQTAGDCFALPRVHVSAGMNLAEFEAHVSGFYRTARAKHAMAISGATA
jgi:peptidoglycan/xylan/chitin deacetylase (PgdA/CDA1 family)